MKAIRNLIESEKKLLLVFFSILIIVCSYRFIFVKYTDKADGLTIKNQELKSQLDELELIQLNKNKYSKDIIEANQTINELLDKFPVKIKQEKSIIFVTQLEKYSDSKVSLIQLEDLYKIYSSSGELEEQETSSNSLNNETDQSATNENTDETGETEETGKTEVTGETGETEEVGKIGETGETDKTGEPDILKDNDFSCYKTAMLLQFKTSYDGLKKCIDYINNYEDRMNIDELTVAYDPSTGQLTGTMKVNQYAVVGINKKYQDVIINDIDIGTDNIFGTFKTP